MPKRALVVKDFIVWRNEIEANPPSVERLADAINLVAEATVREGKIHLLEIAIDGYNADTRELYEIGEVCTWARRALEQLPGIWYFLTPDCQRRFIGWVCGPVSREDISSEAFQSSYANQRTYAIVNGVVFAERALRENPSLIDDIIYSRIYDSKLTAIVTCPNCSQKLRIPRRSGTLRLTCPKCKTSFLHSRVESTINLFEALENSLKKRIERVSRFSENYKSFMLRYLDTTTLRSVVGLAKEKMELTLSDGKGHSYSYDERELLHFIIQTIPASNSEAAEWYTREYGGYLQFHCRAIDFPIFRIRKYKALVHFIFGVEARNAPKVSDFWACIGILPIGPMEDWDIGFAPLLYPGSCLNQEEWKMVKNVVTVYD